MLVEDCSDASAATRPHQTSGGGEPAEDASGLRGPVTVSSSASAAAVCWTHCGVRSGAQAGTSSPTVTSISPAFVELLDQPDGGRRIRDDDMEQVGVYVLAALLLPLLRRAPHGVVEVDVPLRRAWMTAARRLGQRRLSSRSTRCGGRPRQRAERGRVRQRRRIPYVGWLRWHYWGRLRTRDVDVGRRARLVRDRSTMSAVT